jgi:uncharacterized SAM-binding protein YcdF (DUF218 family)
MRVQPRTEARPATTPRSLGRRVLIALAAAGAALLLVLSTCLGLILYHGNNAVPVKADVLIVLGARVYGDDPGPALRLRLDKALELYLGGLAQEIIVCGAQGADEIMPEARVMENYLVAKGIPEELIHQEDGSYSTAENLKYAGEIMQREGFSSCIIVTSDFHIFRSLLLAERLSIPATAAAAANPFAPAELGWYLIREVLALVKDWLITL